VEEEDAEHLRRASLQYRAGGSAYPRGLCAKPSVFLLLPTYLISLARLSQAFKPSGVRVKAPTNTATHIHIGDRARHSGRWAEAAGAYQAALRAAEGWGSGPVKGEARPHPRGAGRL
jgi:hypothetical protein